MSQSNATTEPAEALASRCTSELLRDILRRNPGVQRFSVARIIASLGHDEIEASLLLFSVPAVIPVSVPTGMLSVPSALIGGGLAFGQRRLRLPRSVLRKQISRRALAIAIHAAAPVLEAAERIVRPRWHWISHPISRRAIGFLIFLLACSIAYPLAGSNALHGLSIFVMSLGLAERDGLTILIGVVAGVLSLAVVAATGFTPRALRKQVMHMLRKLARKLGLHALARWLDRLGFRRIAKLLTLDWAKVVMEWDPEQTAPDGRAAVMDAAPTPSGADSPRPVSPVYRAHVHSAHRSARSRHSIAGRPAGL
jgi:hypothetical protein